MATTTRRRPSRPVTEYAVTRVIAANVDGSEVSRIPGLRFTLTDIQGVMTHRMWEGVLDTVNVFCEVCGESVVDCPEIAPLLKDPVAEWSWRHGVEDPIY